MPIATCTARTGYECVHQQESMVRSSSPSSREVGPVVSTTRLRAARGCCAAAAVARKMLERATTRGVCGSVEEVMNDLIVRRTPSTELPALAPFHPLRSLRELLSWDPFQEMAPLLPVDIHRVIPPFEVRETKDRYVFMADLPGVEGKDIEILL